MPISRRHIAVAAIASAVAGAAWLLAAGSAVRVDAPSVQYTLLDGRQLDTAELKGKVVLVNFWATSCTTCVAEMPHIVAVHQKFSVRGYTTIAVAMSYDTPAYVAGFADSRRLPFNVAFDKSGAVARSFGDVQLTPTSFLIDKRGQVVKRYVGAPDFAALDKLVEQLLAET